MSINIHRALVNTTICILFFCYGTHLGGAGISGNYNVKKTVQSKQRSIPNNQWYRRALKQLIGDRLYGALIGKPLQAKVNNSNQQFLDAQTYEGAALKKDPKPWEKFTAKSGYFWRLLNWLARGKLGQIEEEAHEIYEFPQTKDGQRAQFIYMISLIYPDTYKQIWLDEKAWAHAYASSVSRLPNITFGQYWFKPLNIAYATK